jgi:holo-[acyl-carrier protein] synthase
MKRPKDIQNVGLDLVEIDRFTKLCRAKSPHGLRKLFFQQEIEYCMSYKDAAPHFAGMFAAKEAVSKALSVKTYPFASIEIRHADDGAPEAWFGGKRLPISVSISHTDSLAAAIAVR